MGAKQILVVDDEAMVLESVRMSLTHLGYIVETASDAWEALKKLAAADFALLVTDRKMSGMTGEELALEVQKRFPNLPIILLTGFAPDDKPAGISQVLLKPFSLAELKNAIAALLDPMPDHPDQRDSGFSQG